MVNSPLIRPYSWGGVALGGVARIPMKKLGMLEMFFDPLVFFFMKFFQMQFL